MALKVKKAPLPFKALSQLDRETSAEVKRILTQVMSLIEAELRNSQPDPDEMAVTGVNAPLQKSLTYDLPRTLAEKAVRAFNRREVHAAPNNLDQLAAAVVDQLILLLPWSGGSIIQDPALTRKPQDDLPAKEKVVPLAQIRVGSFTSAELKTALEGSKKMPELIHLRGGTEFWVTQGSAEVFAGKVVGLPAMRCLVREAEDVQLEEYKGQAFVNLAEVETLARKFVSGETYQVSSELEPLAEQARDHNPVDYQRLLTGEEDPAKQEARARAEAKDLERVKVWFELFTNYRKQGFDEEAAQDKVREDPKWLRMELIAENSLELAVRIEQRWDEWRYQFAKALKLAEMYAQVDGKELTIPDDLYFRATKVKRPKDESSMGSLIGIYQSTEKVEVRSARGEWFPAEVIRTGGGLVRVRYDDGSYAAIDDPTAIRRPDEGNVGLDNSTELEYNDGMSEIRLNNFNVIIPAGTNSLKIELAHEPITAEMNNTPLVVNEVTWKKNHDEKVLEVERLTAECHRIAGKEFRPNASADCAKILFGDRGLPVQRVSKGKGEPSVDKETLQALQSMGDDLAGPIINAREAISQLSQLNAWAPFAKLGKVQATWNQQGTPMGRFSCDTPNLQNRIVEIRETIEAPAGYKLLSVDLGQAEYVVWASNSGDPTLSKAFIDGNDFHLQMINEVRTAAPGIDLHETDPRQSGKTINFALLYLMQAFVLAKKLGIESAEAQQLIDAYYRRAPLAKQYLDEYLDQVKKTGQTSTKFGRTRYMPEMKSAKGPALHEGRKTAWHHHNSGTAAEILKLKTVRAWRALRQEYDAELVVPVLQMHDELILQVRDDIVEDVKQITLDKFNSEIKGFLPFKIDCRVGQHWRSISK